MKNNCVPQFLHQKQLYELPWWNDDENKFYPFLHNLSQNLFFGQGLKHLLTKMLHRRVILTLGDSEQHGRFTSMQSLLHEYPGKTGADELEPVSLASVKCSDLAMDCSFEARGTSQREVIRQLIEHMESEHSIPVLTAEAMYRFKKAIKKP